jgi:hypothetical protein
LVIVSPCVRVRLSVTVRFSPRPILGAMVRVRFSVRVGLELLLMSGIGLCLG